MNARWRGPVRSVLGAIAVVALPTLCAATFKIDLSGPADSGAGVASILYMNSSATGSILDLTPSAAVPDAPTPPAFAPGGSPFVVASGQTINASDIPATFTSLEVQPGATVLVDANASLPATGTADDIRIGGTFRFVKGFESGTLSFRSTVAVLERTGRIHLESFGDVIFRGEQLFVDGSIDGRDYAGVTLSTDSAAATNQVFGGRIKAGGNSRVDFRCITFCNGDVILRDSASIKLGPDSEIDGGGARFVLAGRIKARGKPNVGAGGGLFIRTTQLLGTGGTFKAKGEFGEVLLGDPTGKQWESAKFTGSIDVRGGADAGSASVAGEQTLEVAAKINASGTDTGGSIAFGTSSSTPVLPPCSALRATGGITSGTVTLNGVPICP